MKNVICVQSGEAHYKRGVRHIDYKKELPRWFGSSFSIYRLKLHRLRFPQGRTAKWIQTTLRFCSISSSSKSSLLISLMSSRIEAYRNACSIPMQRMSTAQPVRWFDIGTPPTALFTAGDLNPLLMIIGSSPSPYRLFQRLLSCSSHWHTRFKFSTCASFGTFSIPVFVLVNSRSVKCSESFSCLYETALLIIITHY